MIRGIYVAAKGMALQVNRQEVISNNLANSNTTGFKKDTTLVHSFGEQLLALKASGEKTPIGTFGQGPLIETIATNFAPGVLEETGRTLDLALVGPAFFTLQTPTGLGYTKDGSFGLDQAGYIVSSDGHRPLDHNGQPLHLQTDQIMIDEDGGIWSSNLEDNQFLGRLSLAVFQDEDLQKLTKRGQNMFEAGDVTTTQGVGQVRQGMLENANLEVIREMVDMINVMRVYEASQKSLQAHDEMLGKSINEVGRLR